MLVVRGRGPAHLWSSPAAYLSFETPLARSLAISTAVRRIVTVRGVPEARAGEHGEHGSVGRRHECFEGRHAGGGDERVDAIDGASRVFEPAVSRVDLQCREHGLEAAVVVDDLDAYEAGVRSDGPGAAPARADVEVGEQQLEARADGGRLQVEVPGEAATQFDRQWDERCQAHRQSGAGRWRYPSPVRCTSSHLVASASAVGCRAGAGCCVGGGMSRFESWSIVLAGASVLANVALFFGAMVQLRLVRRQLERGDLQDQRDHDRRRADATFQHITATLGAWHRLRDEGLPPTGVGRVVGYLDEINDWCDHDDPRNQLVERYLGGWEAIATAVNLGVYDLAVVIRLRGDGAVAIWREFGEWILHRRLIEARPFLFAEVEELAYVTVDYLAEFEGGPTPRAVKKVIPEPVRRRPVGPAGAP